jgi:WD40 repeat protein
MFRAITPVGDTVTAIFTQVIERLEEEFHRELVGSVLSVLASARRGLAERELQELVAGMSGKEDLFPVLRQLRTYLLSRAGLIGFYHRNLHTAVFNRYLKTPQTEHAAHARLTEYFGGQDYFLEAVEAQHERARRLPPTVRPVNLRKIDELPWQCLQMIRAARSGTDIDTLRDAFHRLETLFQDIHFLEAKTEVGLVFDLADELRLSVETLPAGRPDRRLICLLDEALRRHLHFVARHPMTLFQSLWNVCWWYDCPNAAKYYDPPEGGWPPDGPPWNRPGPKLYLLLRAWRQTKTVNGEAVFPWLHALRPPYLPLGTAQRAVFTGHQGPVNTIVLSPDGFRLASGSDDGTVRIWSLSTGAEVLRLEQGGPVGCIAFSPDGQWIAAGTDSRRDTVRIWNADTGILHLGLRVPPDQRTRQREAILETRQNQPYFEFPLPEHDYQSATALLFSSDSKRLLVEDGLLESHWDIGTGTLVEKVGDLSWPEDVRLEAEFHAGKYAKVAASARSPERRWLAYAASVAGNSDDKVVRIVDLTDSDRKAPARSYFGHEKPITALVFSKEGGVLVSSSKDQTIRIWSLDQGGSPPQRRDHSPPDTLGVGIATLGFSADGAHLFSSGGVLWLWRIENFSRPLEMPFQRSFSLGTDDRNPTFSPDGRFIAFGDNDSIGIVNVASKSIIGWLRVLTPLPCPLRSLAFDLDGKRLAGIDWNGVVRVWDLTGISRSDSTTNAEQERALYSERVGPWPEHYQPDGRITVEIPAWYTRRIAEPSTDPATRTASLVILEVAGRPWTVLERIPADRWEAVADVTQTEIRRSATGVAAAWWPAPLDPIAQHPRGRIWAGAAGGRLEVFAWEGAEILSIDRALPDRLAASRQALELAGESPGTPPPPSNTSDPLFFACPRCKRVLEAEVVGRVMSSKVQPRPMAPLGPAPSSTWAIMPCTCGQNLYPFWPARILQPAILEWSLDHGGDMLVSDLLDHGWRRGKEWSAEEWASPRRQSFGPSLHYGQVLCLLDLRWADDAVDGFLNQLESLGGSEQLLDALRRAPPACRLNYGCALLQVNRTGECLRFLDKVGNEQDPAVEQLRVRLREMGIM